MVFYVTVTFMSSILYYIWRYTDLESIHSQLKSSEVNKMAMVLEAVESSYFPAFMNMQQDVLAGKDTIWYIW